MKSNGFLSYFFLKKYLLVGAWDMLWAGGAWFMDHGSWIMVQWIMDQRSMYVTPIRLDPGFSIKFEVGGWSKSSRRLFQIRGRKAPVF